MKNTLIAVSLLLTSSFAWSVDAPDPARTDADESARLAAEVKSEFLHAWKDYREYAWGHDDLAPLTHKPDDRGKSLRPFLGEAGTVPSVPKGRGDEIVYSSAMIISRNQSPSLT